MRDFALWKAAKPEDEAVGAAWDAPFGRGRPGGTSSARRWRSTSSSRSGEDVSTSMPAESTSSFRITRTRSRRAAPTPAGLFARYWVPRRVPQDRRREDGQAVREHRHRERSAGRSRGCGSDSAAHVSGPLSPAARPDGRGVGECEPRDQRRLGEFQRRLGESAAGFTDAPRNSSRLAKRLEAGGRRGAR